MQTNTDNILIVEDEYLIAVDIKLTLEEAGYAVGGIALNGEEGLNLFDSLRPGLVLMDIVLGGEMDGISTVEKIRQDSDVPVIFISGNIDDRNISRISGLRNCTWLSKPCDDNVLRSVVQKAFAGDIPPGQVCS